MKRISTWLMTWVCVAVLGIGVAIVSGAEPDTSDPSGETRTGVVLPLKAGVGINADEVEFLTDRLAAVLGQISKLVVVPPSQTAERLAAGGWPEAGPCTAADCAVAAGKILGVDYVVFGSVGHVAELYSLTTTLVKVDTGKTVKTAMTDSRGDMTTFAADVPRRNLKSLLNPDDEDDSGTAATAAPSRQTASRSSEPRPKKMRTPRPVPDVVQGWRIPVGLTYVSGAGDVFDVLEDYSGAREVTRSDTGLSLHPYYQFAHGSMLGFEFGPITMVMGDVEYWDIPIGVAYGFAILPKFKVSPYVRVGGKYHLVGGDYVESSTPGLFGAVGMEFRRKNRLGVGFEFAYDTSEVTFSRDTVSVSRADDGSWRTRWSEEEETVKPGGFMASIFAAIDL